MLIFYFYDYYLTFQQIAVFRKRKQTDISKQIIIFPS